MIGTHSSRAIEHFDRHCRTSKSPLTLNEEYAKRGYVTVHSSRKNLVSVKHVVRNGRIVTTKTAFSSWYWLARLDRKVAALRAARRFTGLRVAS